MQQTICIYGQILNMVQPEREEKEHCKVLYLLLPEKKMINLQDLADRYGLNIVEISGMDWGKDLTPWAAPGVFKGQNDFQGSASEYMQLLLYELVPYAEKYMGITVCERILGGVSLAGMFTVYTLYHTDLFTGGLSVSGSFWYDGFIDFMKKGKVPETVKTVYLSLGIKEKNTKNKRMRTVEKCTWQVSEILQKSGILVEMEQMPGNHFANMPERIEKAVAWVMQQGEKQNNKNEKKQEKTDV